MSWFADPQPGDWVQVRRRVPVTLTDHLTDGGLPAGSRACVLARHGSRLELQVDAGWGSCRATVSTRDVRVSRRGAGVAAFSRRMRLLTTIRVSLALMIAWPVLRFVGEYWWVNRTFDDIVPAFVEALLEGIPEQLEAALAEPWKALASTVLFVVLSRIAFGPRKE